MKLISNSMDRTYLIRPKRYSSGCNLHDGLWLQSCENHLQKKLLSCYIRKKNFTLLRYDI